MKSTIMLALFTLVLFLGVLVMAHVAHAEGGCPTGMIPANGTNINSCVPIPSGYYGEQQQAQSVINQPEWARGWGAIATDSIKGSLGAALGVSSQSEAEQLAIDNCQLKGGSQCQVDVSYSNGCGAMIVGDGGYNSNSAATVDEAVRLGMLVCSEAGRTNCHTYYTSCSPAVRIR